MSYTREMIATETGFYGGRRVREGQRFFAGKDFKAGWAKPVQREKPAPKKAKEKESDGDGANLA